MTMNENTIRNVFRVYVNIAQGRIDHMQKIREEQMTALLAFFEHMTGIRQTFTNRKTSTEMFLILDSMGFDTYEISIFMGIEKSSVRSIKSRIAGSRKTVKLIHEFLDISCMETD